MTVTLTVATPTHLVWRVAAQDKKNCITSFCEQLSKIAFEYEFEGLDRQLSEAEVEVKNNIIACRAHKRVLKIINLPEDSILNNPLVSAKFSRIITKLGKEILVNPLFPQHALEEPVTDGKWIWEKDILDDFIKKQKYYLALQNVVLESNEGLSPFTGKTVCPTNTHFYLKDLIQLIRTLPIEFREEETTSVPASNPGMMLIPIYQPLTIKQMIVPYADIPNPRIEIAKYARYCQLAIAAIEKEKSRLELKKTKKDTAAIDGKIQKFKDELKTKINKFKEQLKLNKDLFEQRLAQQEQLSKIREDVTNEKLNTLDKELGIQKEQAARQKGWADYQQQELLKAQLIIQQNQADLARLQAEMNEKDDDGCVVS